MYIESNKENPTKSIRIFLHRLKKNIIEKKTLANRILRPTMYGCKPPNRNIYRDNHIFIYLKCIGILLHTAA